MILVFVIEFMYLYYVKIVDCYINTIGDMRNEKDFFHHCKKFESNHDFEKFLLEFFCDTLGYDVLNNNVCLCEIGYYNVLLLVCLFD